MITPLLLFQSRGGEDVSPRLCNDSFVPDRHLPLQQPFVFDVRRTIESDNYCSIIYFLDEITYRDSMFQDFTGIIYSINDNNRSILT